MSSDRGRLVLDVDAVDRLLATVEAGGTAGLARILPGDPPEVSRLLDHVRDATTQISVVVSGPRSVQVHQAWLVSDDGTALAQAEQGYELLPLPPVMAPCAVARLAGLGPRPRLGGGFSSHGFMIERLLAREEGERVAAADALARQTLPSWSGLANHLRSGRWRMWRADVTSADGGRSMTVVDTPGGLARVMPGDRWSVHASDPTSVWREIVAAIACVERSQDEDPAASTRSDER